ncbi:MAG: vWA domain-containing protein [Phycisphaerae bacterium]
MDTTIRARVNTPTAIRHLVASLGCSLTLMMSGCADSGDFGITTGGQQDIASARSIIESGGVPSPSSVTVEGFLSEHDIPVSQPDDAGELYATVATAWNDDFDAFTPLATIQLGFGTNVDSDDFERAPLNLAIAIDISGSMGEAADRTTSTSRLEAVKIAVDRLLAQLTDDDRVSIVAFNSLALTRLEAAAGTDVAAIKGAIDTLVPDGSTDLARGASTAFQLVQRNQSDDRDDRIIVFTDALLTARPGVQEDELLDVMEFYAERNIGATLFGIGSDFGNETALAISQIRGGNYFFLSDFERIVSVFDDEFDLLVTPVALDVQLTMDIPFAFDVEGVYGIPAEEPFPHILNLEIPTLFLSNRDGGGAMLVRLRAGSLVDFDVDNIIANVDLSYTDRNGDTVEIEQLQATLPAGLDAAASESYFENDSVQRAVLLLNTAHVLIDSLEDAFPTFGFFVDTDDEQRAIDRLSAFLTYFDNLAEGLNDRESENSRTLSEERDLLEQLIFNIF